MLLLVYENTWNDWLVHWDFKLSLAVFFCYDSSFISSSFSSLFSLWINICILFHANNCLVSRAKFLSVKQGELLLHHIPSIKKSLHSAFIEICYWDVFYKLWLLPVYQTTLQTYCRALPFQCSCMESWSCLTFVQLALFSVRKRAECN